MPVSCCVYCTKRFATEERWSFRFPCQPEWLRLWMLATRRQTLGLNWIPNEHTGIYSYDFIKGTHTCIVLCKNLDAKTQCMTVCGQANMATSWSANLLLWWLQYTYLNVHLPTVYKVSPSVYADDPDYVLGYLLKANTLGTGTFISSKHCVFVSKFLQMTLIRLATSSNICVPLMKLSLHNQVCLFRV